MPDARPLHQPFPTLARQHEADRLGMLIFLTTEVLLFGGLFAVALLLRLEHPQAYAASSRQMHIWLGGINTAVLLTSSALVALMIEAVRAGIPRVATWLLLAAIAMGILFLAVKFIEYGLEYRDGLVPLLSDFALDNGPGRLFMDLYFVATGLHAFHVTVGGVLLASLIWPFGEARKDRCANFAGNAALYWHLVDIVWIFLYPTLYLAR